MLWNPHKSHKVFEQCPSAGTQRDWTKRAREGTKWKRPLDPWYSPGKRQADKDNSAADTCYLSWKRKACSEGGRNQGPGGQSSKLRMIFPGFETLSNNSDWCFPGWISSCFGTLTPFCLLFPPILNLQVYSWYPMPISSLCVGGKELVTLVSLVPSWRGIVRLELHCMDYTQDPHPCPIWMIEAMRFWTLEIKWFWWALRIKLMP